jgi:mono/diheme cytochrome c family protein
VSRAGLLAACGAVVALCGSYLAWNDDAGSSPSASAAPLDGASLFHTKGCATCHTGPDTVSEFTGQFPSLRHASEWAGTRRPDMSAKDYVKQSMLDPGEFISPAFTARGGPTAYMPDLHLTEQEADALVDYLLRG